MSLPLGKYDFKLRQVKGRTEIFDISRRTYVSFTPEEFVRQHLLHYLITDKKYPPGLIKTEQGIIVNETNKRSDIIVYDKEGAVFILCECKAAKVKIDFTTIEQIMMYNQTLHAKYFILSNGSHTIFAKHEADQLIELDDIPMYS